MNRARPFAVTALLLGALGVPAPARACEPVGPNSFSVMPSSTDQVPPTLPPIAAPMINRPDGSAQEGCGSSTCKDPGSVAIAAMATDDVTARPGYRFTLAAGTLPPGYALPDFPLAASGNYVVLHGAAGDGDSAFDYTLQVVAVDGAGNESAPQTVRVADDPGGACAVARPRRSAAASAAIVAAALLLTVRRRRRNPPEPS